jgi:hypothetical protein
MADQDMHRSGTSAASGPGMEGTLNQAKDRAAELAGRAKEQGKSMAARQKDAAAAQLDSVASAVRDTARRLEGDRSGGAGRYVSMAAERLESFGRQLREKDVDRLIDDAQSFARRSPMAFFGGSVLAGFLLARFLRSSSAGHAEGESYMQESATGSSQEAEQAVGREVQTPAGAARGAVPDAPPAMSVGHTGG